MALSACFALASQWFRRTFKVSHTAQPAVARGPRRRPLSFTLLHADSLPIRFTVAKRGLRLDLLPARVRFTDWPRSKPPPCALRPRSDAVRGGAAVRADRHSAPRPDGRPVRVAVLGSPLMGFPGQGGSRLSTDAPVEAALSSPSHQVHRAPSSRRGPCSLVLPAPRSQLPSMSDRGRSCRASTPAWSVLCATLGVVQRPMHKAWELRASGDACQSTASRSAFRLSQPRGGLLRAWGAGLLHPAAGPELRRVWHEGAVLDSAESKLSSASSTPSTRGPSTPARVPSPSPRRRTLRSVPLSDSPRASPRFRQPAPKR